MFTLIEVLWLAVKERRVLIAISSIIVLLVVTIVRTVCNMRGDGAMRSIIIKSINVSLNLPIIRTSVDHGTAFDIAYKGVAKISSFIEAASWAVKLYETKNLKN